MSQDGPGLYGQIFLYQGSCIFLLFAIALILHKYLKISAILKNKKTENVDKYKQVVYYLVIQTPHK